MPLSFIALVRTGTGEPELNVIAAYHPKYQLFHSPWAEIRIGDKYNRKRMKIILVILNISSVYNKDIKLK